MLIVYEGHSATHPDQVDLRLIDFARAHFPDSFDVPGSGDCGCEGGRVHVSPTVGLSPPDDARRGPALGEIAHDWEEEDPAAPDNGSLYGLRTLHRLLGGVLSGETEDVRAGCKGLRSCSEGSHGGGASRRDTTLVSP